MRMPWEGVLPRQRANPCEAHEWANGWQAARPGTRRGNSRPFAGCEWLQGTAWGLGTRLSLCIGCDTERWRDTNDMMACGRVSISARHVIVVVVVVCFCCRRLEVNVAWNLKVQSIKKPSCRAKRGTCLK